MLINFHHDQACRRGCADLTCVDLSPMVDVIDHGWGRGDQIKIANSRSSRSLHDFQMQQSQETRSGIQNQARLNVSGSNWKELASLRASFSDRLSLQVFVVPSCRLGTIPQNTTGMRGF